jgi:hypothetical protein
MFRHLGKDFMQPSEHDKIPLCKVLYFVGCTGLIAEWESWGCKIDDKMIAVQGSPYDLNTLIVHSLIQNWLN